MASQALRHMARIAVAAAMLAALSTGEARADRLAEFLFWNELGQAAGEGVRSYMDYRELRASTQQNIAAAKEELARCGGCAEAQARLEKWQGEENRFQDVAGSLAASVGMPETVADFLDIDMPLSAGRTPAQREQECAIEVPSWSAARPAFCREAVEAHLACLRGYEQEHGYCSANNAVRPGGRCWDPVKLVRYCGSQAFEAFDLERRAQTMRRENPAIPEYLDYGNRKLVLYSHLPPDFTPAMPPEEVTRAEFADEKLQSVTWSLRKTAPQHLGKVELRRWFWSHFVPSSDCFRGSRPRDEIARRICEDLTEFSQYLKPLVLSCWYSEGAKSALPDASYWYGRRPPAAEPERLLRRATAHPLLAVQKPRTDCPATLVEAERLEAAHRRQLAGLGVAQVPAATALRSEHIKRRQQEYEEQANAHYAAALRSFPIEGYFQMTGSTLNRGRWKAVRRAECTVAETATGGGGFEIACGKGRRRFFGRATAGEDGLLVRWDGGREVLFNVAGSDGNTLSGKVAGREGYQEILLRVGTFSPEQVVEVVRDYPFGGSYDLELTHDGETIRLECHIDRQEEAIPHAFPTICYTAEGVAFKSRGTPDGSEPLSLDYPTFYAAHARPSLPLRVGGQQVRNLRFPIDPALRGRPAASLAGASEDGVRARLARVGRGPMMRFGTPPEADSELAKLGDDMRAAGIFSLEQLAAVSVEDAAALGRNTPHLRNRAREVLGLEAGGTTAAPAPPAETAAQPLRTPPNAAAAPTATVPVVPEQADAVAAVPAEDAVPCPASFRAARAGSEVVECACPENPVPRRIFGTDVYTDTSSICVAAVHAGAVGVGGGVVAVEGIPGADSYEGSLRNGIRSNSWKRTWPASFRFLERGAGPAGAGD